MFNKNLLIRFLLSAIFLSAGPALAAQDSTQVDTKQPSESTPHTDESPKPTGVDDLITNNSLRALSGSTSKWSIATSFNYNGSTVQTPFSENRPDISGASGNTDKTDLDGTINIKYNIDVKNSLLAGFGVRWIAPLSPNGPSNYPGTRYDAVNPSIAYQYLYKWFGIQSVLQAGMTKWTQADQTAIGSDYNYGFDQENVYEIGSTGLSIGASLAGQYQTFNKTGPYGPYPDIRAIQSLYEFTLSPYLEYQITEKINFRTLVSLWNFEHYGTTGATHYVHDTVYQSIGLGFSVTRDIFLYPNIQFIPDNIAATDTNIGLTATINLF